MKKKRSYTSETREAQAAETRAGILKAARKLFQVHGFDQVTISELARKAEVAVPTVYAIFKSKRGVLQSLIDEALPSQQRLTLVDESMEEEAPEKRLQVTAKLARQIYDAEKGLMDVLRGASVVAPEFKELEQEREKRRYERQGEYVKKLMGEKRLAKGLSLKKARDVLWALTGRDVYRMLVVDQEWTSDEYEKWLASLLIASLLGRSERSFATKSEKG